MRLVGYNGNRDIINICHCFGPVTIKIINLKTGSTRKSTLIIKYDYSISKEPNKPPHKRKFSDIRLRRARKTQIEPIAKRERLRVVNPLRKKEPITIVIKISNNIWCKRTFKTKMGQHDSEALQHNTLLRVINLAFFKPIFSGKTIMTTLPYKFLYLRWDIYLRNPWINHSGTKVPWSG